jgi:hypothetical protein
MNDLHVCISFVLVSPATIFALRSSHPPLQFFIVLDIPGWYLHALQHPGVFLHLLLGFFSLVYTIFRDRLHLPFSRFINIKVIAGVSDAVPSVGLSPLCSEFSGSRHSHYCIRRPHCCIMHRRGAGHIYNSCFSYFWFHCQRSICLIDYTYQTGSDILLDGWPNI